MTNPITIHNFTGPIRTSGATYGIIVDPEDRDVRDWSHVGPGVPGEVWHRRAILFPVSASAHPASLQQAVEENLHLIKEIFSAYNGPVWDGNNHVGEWQEDADDPIMRVCESAEHVLQQELDAVPCIVEIDDWYGNGGVRTLSDLLNNPKEDVVGKTLRTLAAEIVEIEKANGDVLFAGNDDDQQEEMEQYLLRLVTTELEELVEREEDEDDDLEPLEVAWLFTLRCLWASAQAA